MFEFDIVISSFRQAQDFVRLAMAQPFPVRVDSDYYHINGKDIMGVCSLDFTRPVRVCVTCPEEDYLRFRQEAEQLQDNIGN